MQHRLPQHTLISSAIGLLLSAGAWAEGIESPTINLAPVVVTGARVEHSSFDLPASIQVVEGSQISEGQLRVNASESLAAVPGLVVQNRQNYAQDLQISSRGFGARSAFGVRGVRLIADGIPATMPDGQGQAATFNLDTAERIEVLRGPYSVIYGNHAGGVVQLFSRSGQGAPSLETSVMAGGYGTVKVDVTAQGKPDGNWGYVADASRFATDGYRQHSAATRDQAYAKVTGNLGPDTKLTFVANGLWQDNTQDPLGQTWNTFATKPRGVETAALTFNTRKSIDHMQAGGTWEQRFGTSLLTVTAYAGNRSVIQYQAIPTGPQGNPRHSGGVIDFDRDFGGLGLRWNTNYALSAGTLNFTAGLDLDRSNDDRKGYENFIGSVLGVKGALRRKEDDIVTSVDPYAQAEWLLGAWTLTAGVRNSRVSFEVDDHYIVGVNGNDSGKVDYERTTPMVSAMYKINPALNVYASAARGFETPTLNELFYSGSGGGFNFNLKAAESDHAEIGAKAWLGNDTRLDVALFQVTTKNELVVDVSTGGRTSYKNASSTQREGIEIALETRWQGGLSGRLAYTAMDATYDKAFTSTSGLVRAGSHIPGIPDQSLFGELAWKHAPSGISTALEVQARSKVYVEDRNVDRPAPGYTTAAFRIGTEQKQGAWRFGEFLRVDNLFDKAYAGSVIVGDSNKRYYEAAPGRNWLIGASARYTF
ncbi:MAG TPA: TonB-dependent receptor [Rhodocyclaceae bacterium]